MNEDIFDKLFVKSEIKGKSTDKVIDKLFNRKDIHKKTDIKEKEIDKIVLLQATTKRRNLHLAQSLLDFKFEDRLSKNRLSRKEIIDISNTQAMLETGINPFYPSQFQEQPTTGKKPEIK
jgi:hypothetical protein